MPVIAHDWGAYAAFLLALGHPERIHKLFALDIAPPWGPLRRPSARHLWLPLLASDQAALATPLLGSRLLTESPHAVRTIIRTGSGPSARWSNAELDVYADVLRQPTRAAASVACYRTFLTRELPAMLARGREHELRVPSLLVTGAQSPLRRVLDPQPGPNLRVESIPGAGHFLPEEAPDAVLALATAWLTTDHH